MRSEWTREELLALPERERPRVRAEYNGRKCQAIVSRSPYGKPGWVRVEENGKHVAGMSCGWCLILAVLNDPRETPIVITQERDYAVPTLGG